LTCAFSACYKTFKDCLGHPGSGALVRLVRAERGHPDINKAGGNEVNKSELIDAIAKGADLSKASAGRALDSAIGAVKQGLKKGGIVTLVGFGTFYVGKRVARNGRNPRTGASIKIKAAKIPKFRAGKALKDAIN
jgi:DNA-binding protein HU-beta